MYTAQEKILGTPLFLTQPFTGSLPQSVTAFASRAFTIAAPVVWNSLSANTRSADSLTCFERRLQSGLFATAYATQDSSVPSQRFDLCFMRLIALL